MYESRLEPSFQYDYVGLLRCMGKHNKTKFGGDPNESHTPHTTPLGKSFSSFHTTSFVLIEIYWIGLHRRTKTRLEGEHVGRLHWTEHFNKTDITGHR
jgi:hypothetical protein